MHFFGVVYQSIPSMYTTPGQNTKSHFIDGKFHTPGMHGKKKVQPPIPRPVKMLKPYGVFFSNIHYKNIKNETEIM